MCVSYTNGYNIVCRECLDMKSDEPSLDNRDTQFEQEVRGRLICLQSF